MTTTAPTRAHRYKLPEVTPKHLALAAWFDKLPRNMQEALEGQFNKDRQPIGPGALEELLRDYGQELRNLGRSPRTIDIYLTDLGKLQKFLIRNELDITDMGLAMLHQFTEYLADQGHARISISRILTVLKGFCLFLYRQGVLGLPEMPRPQAFTTKVPKKLPEHLTQEEVTRLLTAPDNLSSIGIRDRAILELFYASGLRIAELVALNLEDLDLERLALLVRHGKGDKQRIGFFGHPCQWAINRYLEESRPYLVEGKPPTEAVFINRDGGRISKRAVELLVKKYAKQAGISKRVYPHILRHTMATAMLEGGAGLRQIQVLLGHANVSTTQVYTHVTESEAHRTLLTYHPRAMKEA